MDYQPIDDEFAKDFSEYETLAEWKNEILANLQERRETSVREKFAREVMAKIIADSEIPIDDDLKEEMTQIYYDDFLDELEMNQIPLELYCKRSGHSEDEIYADKEQEAIEAHSCASFHYFYTAARGCPQVGLHRKPDHDDSTATLRKRTYHLHAYRQRQPVYFL